MKKLFIILFCFILLGCSQKPTSAKEALEKEIKNNYPNSEILCEKSEKEFYLGLLKEDNQIDLVILKNTNDGYQFFGSSSYDCSYQSNFGNNYGKYFYKDEQYSMAAIFSENQDQYSKMTLKYINNSHRDETLSIHYNNHDTYILKLFLLPTEYEFINIKIE